MVWNNVRATVDTNRRVTAARGALHLALSDDDGRTWTALVEAAAATEISYPYLLESGPGRLLVSSGRLRARGRDTDTVLLLTTEARLRE